MERERQLPEGAEPEVTVDEGPALRSESVEVQRTTRAYRDAMAAGRRILEKRRAVLAALAK